MKAILKKVELNKYENNVLKTSVIKIVHAGIIVKKREDKNFFWDCFLLTIRDEINKSYYLFVKRIELRLLRIGGLKSAESTMWRTEKFRAYHAKGCKFLS